MKKLRASQICFLISILLSAGFVVHTIADYIRYSSTLNSAPFSVWVIVNGICFLLPALISVIVGLILRNKAK